jgi:GNAT superfamily N-acetyltransferase
MTAAVSAASSTALRVREVPRGESLRPFIDFAWTANAGDPHWVPPLRVALEPGLDRAKHPFHQHADVAYFVAERDAETVGRIAAIVNHRHNEFHEDRVGFFGLFESVEDPRVARALADAAAGWLKARGMVTMRGPMNLSTNEEISSPGVLVDGFDTPPTVAMSHNPPYYGALLEGAGLEKAKDLLAFWIGSPIPPERLVRGVERMTRREGVTLRSMNMRRLPEEVAVIEEIYNSAWARNWGFVPMTPEEFAYMAKDLKSVVDPDLCIIAEKEGDPVGFAISLPNLNEAIRHIPDGKLFPFGFLKFLWYKRKIGSARIMTLGLRPEYQKSSGIGAAMYLRTFQVAGEHGYNQGEASWILEDNFLMRQALEKVGFELYKTYRVYERGL